MRNNKGQFTKGHPSIRPIKKGNQVITWTCENCHLITSRTLKDLRYRKQKQRFCSIGCAYQFGARTGMVTSDITKTELRNQKLGAKNPSWRGGVSPNRVRLCNTPEYKIWRKSVYERDDYTCRWCGERGGTLEADHITPYMINNEQLLDIDNGQTLCKYCHRIKTSIELKENWRNQYD